MGKAALLIVLGFIVIYGMVRININKTSESASINSSEYTEILLARNIANSAIEYGLSVYTNSGNDTSYSNSDFLGGSFTATYTNLSDTLRLTVTATYEDESYTSRIDILSQSSVMPSTTASGSFKSPNVSYFFSDSILISGVDTNIDGTAGPAPDLPGITVVSPADSVAVAAEIAGNTSWVQGSTAIEVDSSTLAVNLSELFSYYQGVADMTLTGGAYTNVNWGTQADPVIVYVSGDMHLKGNSVGYGILAINGNLRMSESPTWYGLIMVHGDSVGAQDTRIENNSRIFGGIISDSPDNNLRITNFTEIHYSSEALEMVQSDLESTGGYASTRIITEKIWYE